MKTGRLLTRSRFTLGMLILGLTLLGTQPAAAMEFLSFGTGSPAGTYYFLGAGFS